MKMIRRLKLMVCFVLVFTFFTGYVQAVKQKDGDAGLPGAYLSWGVGGRALGMGKAYVSIANDATAPYWNPAGLAFLRQQEVIAQYTSLFETTFLSYLGYSRPFFDLGVFGIGLVDLRSLDFERTESGPDVLGHFNESNDTIFLSYARRQDSIYSIPVKLSYGANFKIVNQSVLNYSATGIGIDVGVMSKPIKGLSLGFMVQNVLPPRLKLDEESDTFPLSGRLGASYECGFNVYRYNTRATVSIEMDKTEHRKGKFHYGFEYKIRDMVGLRAGLDDSELTLGLGLSIKNYDMDYAYGSQEMGTSHRLSLGISFGRVLPLVGTKEWEEAKTVRSYYKKAKKYCRKQEYLIATEELQKALSLDMEDKASKRYTRKIQNKMEDAVGRAEFENIEDFYYAQAYIDYKEGDVDNAITQWELLLGVNPARQEVKDYLEKEKARLEKEAELERKRLSEEEKKVKIKDAYDMQIRCYDGGKWSKSIVYGKRVLRLEPEHQEAKDYIAGAKKRLKEEAERRARKRVKKKPEPTPEEKAEEIKIEVDPEIIEGYYKQGIIYYSQGKYQEAIIEWKKVLALEPTHEKAPKNIKKAQEKLGISE
ncbi:hypothetical protein ES705_37555 [subsurface metagenome]